MLGRTTFLAVFVGGFVNTCAIQILKLQFLSKSTQSFGR